MQINGARVLYNSAAIGMGTSMLASMFIGLFGFYVVSNAVRRDVDSRCGYVIASTTMRTGEYIVGKFLGNVVFLTTFIAGYMAASMAMLLVRGEAPLEPLIFMKQYAIVTPSTIVFISVAAIVFESIPWLSGRFGDVLYFFVYAASLGIVASSMEHGGGGSAPLLRLQRIRLPDGADAARRFTRRRCRSARRASIPPKRRSRSPDSISPATPGPRASSRRSRRFRCCCSRALFFHRFDPARIRAAGAKGKRGWMRSFNALARPFARPLAAIPVRGAALTDAMMTFAITPFAGIALIGITIAALAAPKSLPITFAIAAVFIADIASRDRRAGTTGSHLRVSAPPRELRPLEVRVVLDRSGDASDRSSRSEPDLRVIIGILFIAAAATSLGVISGNPKTFIVLFLTFWYVVVNDHGKTKPLDFAGFFATPAIGVMAMYAAIAIVLLAAAEMVHRARLRV